MGLAVLAAVVGLASGARAEAAPTGVELRIADGSVVWSEALTMTAVVPRSLTAKPTGTITFVADGTLTVATATLKAGAVPVGTVTVARRSLPPGRHTIVATYSGDRRYPPSTSEPIAVRVDPARGAVTLRSTRTVVASGTVGRFTARVAPVPPATAVPTGSLTFKTAGVVRTVPIVDGVATWKPRLPDGVHQVRAILPAGPAWAEAPSELVAQRFGPEPVPTLDREALTRAEDMLFIQPSGPYPAAAQVVTAGITGTLEAVELEVVCLGGGPGPPGSQDPIISIKALSGDSPTGALLARADPIGEYDPVTGLIRMALSAPVPVTAGSRFAIVIGAPSTVLGCSVGVATDGQGLVQLGPTWTAGSTALRHRTWVRPAG